MTRQSQIIFCGDIHGNWKYINALINKKHPEIVLVAGDWGWWINFHNKTGFYTDAYGDVTSKKWNQFGTKPNNTKIYWVPGNHENHDDLAKYTSITELEPNIFYCPFGTVLTLPTGEKVLMVGKALSTDQEDRIEGVDWWRNETIDQSDMDKLTDIWDMNIDVVISHTIPRTFMKDVQWEWYKERFNDQSTVALDIIFKHFKPRVWYSGHFHHYIERQIQGCHWISLDRCDNQNVWWKYHENNS